MLLELIKNRKSIRDYQNKKIPNSDLKKILEAGYYAPSWMNSQPWKFILVENQENKDGHSSSNASMTVRTNPRKEVRNGNGLC